MISDWELWACAQEMVRQHGRDAPEAVAARVTDLAAHGDVEGVATWRAIAERVDQLTDFKSVGRTRH